MPADTTPEPDRSPWWSLQRGGGPVVATAIHDGTGLRSEVQAMIALPAADRVREEDPYTGQAILDVPTHVIAGRSRFEVDLNRACPDAVYLAPEQAWGLNVWKRPLEDSVVRRSLHIHRAFYAMLGQLLDGLIAEHGRFIVLDVHSYNHRRAGPAAPATPSQQAPDINIGTHSMPRAHWAPLLDSLMQTMRGFDYLGGHLDVRENVAFQGKGELTRFVHERYPSTGCAIAIEFKKFYMDEWTGQPDPEHLAAMRSFIKHVACAGAALLDA
ncbi:MAG: N-formylglutamate amidohydrolase [Rubrivivax sp.]